MGQKIMESGLLNNCTVAPDEGQRVVFALHGRDVTMRGTYAQRTFHSRWSGYEVERVRFWGPDGTDTEQLR